jgi:PKHD-type hydroxylase
MYRHPVSEKIHAVKDIDGQFIVFNLRYQNFKNFWHAVYTKNGSRLSYGMKFGKKQLFELGLPNIWNLPYEPPIVVSKQDFVQHHYASFNTVVDEAYVDWVKDTLVTSLYTFDVREAKDFKKCSKVGWTDNKSLCTTLAEKVQQCNNEMFGFTVENLSECVEYREFDETYQNKSDWFMDVQDKHYDRKLSVIMFLSDPSEYEGGELHMITSKGTNVVSEKRKGGLVVFPSYLLYRVGPITKGKLKMVMGWVT